MSDPDPGPDPVPDLDGEQRSLVRLALAVAAEEFDERAIDMRDRGLVETAEDFEALAEDAREIGRAFGSTDE